MYHACIYTYLDNQPHHDVVHNGTLMRGDRRGPVPTIIRKPLNNRLSPYRCISEWVAACVMGSRSMSDSRHLRWLDPGACGC